MRHGCSRRFPGWRAFDLAHIASAYGPADHAVSPDLATLLGRPPRSLADLLDDHADAFAAEPDST